MNFLKPTKKKVILSIVVLCVWVLINVLKFVFTDAKLQIPLPEGCNNAVCLIGLFGISFIIVLTIIYLAICVIFAVLRKN